MVQNSSILKLFSFWQSIGGCDSLTERNLETDSIVQYQLRNYLCTMSATAGSTEEDLQLHGKFEVVPYQSLINPESLT